MVVFLVGILLIAGLWSSYYTVGAESEGVVLRFGKFLKTVEPGLHFRLPYGIEAVTVLPTRRQLKLEFGFATPLRTKWRRRQRVHDHVTVMAADLSAIVDDARTRVRSACLV